MKKKGKSKIPGRGYRVASIIFICYGILGIITGVNAFFTVAISTGIVSLVFSGAVLAFGLWLKKKAQSIADHAHREYTPTKRVSTSEPPSQVQRPKPTPPPLSKASPSKISISPLPISNLKSLEAVESYVVLDTETTGLSRQSDRIIEIALIRYESDKEAERYETLVNPRIHIPSGASKINHITDADVVNAPVIEDVLPEVLRIIGDRVVVGHNITFDLGFVSAQIPASHPSTEIRYVDTVTLSKRAFPGLSSYKLSSLSKQLGIADLQSHRALGDVELTAQLFEKCREELIQSHQKELAQRRSERESKKAEKIAAYSWSPLLNKNFVFTGEFTRDRAQLEAVLETVGANLRSEVNRNTDYLVLGELKNLPQWALERKYLKAKNLAESGGKVQLISESEYIRIVHDATTHKP